MVSQARFVSYVSPGLLLTSPGTLVAASVQGIVACVSCSTAWFAP